MSGEIKRMPCFRNDGSVFWADVPAKSSISLDGTTVIDGTKYLLICFTSNENKETNWLAIGHERYETIAYAEIKQAFKDGEGSRK